MFVQIQKKYQFILLTLMTLFLAGCETFNSQLATSAAVDVIQAVTLSDGQIRQLSQQVSQTLIIALGKPAHIGDSPEA